MASIGFKVSYNGVIRFVNNPSSWDELVERIRASHAIPADNAVFVTYVDEDGDKITIDTNPEFEELVSYAQRSGAKSVKIDVVVSAAGSAPAPADQSRDAFIMVVESAREGVERMNISTPGPDAEAARKRAEEEAEAARKKAEEEAEAARKRAQEEAEAARKKAEEAAEAARKRAEEEAEAARKRAQEEEAAYQAFLANLQPQVDTILSLIETAPPAYIPRLIQDLGPSLASRSWGLTIENMMGQTMGSTRQAPAEGGACPRRGHGHGHGHGHGRWWRMRNDPDAEKRWWNVTCDGCNKREWVGTRWRCQTCNDYDLCDDCHARRHDVHPDVTHEFEAIAQPDAFWNYVSCDGCGKKGLTDRFKCQTCDDYDLCASCHAKAATVHDAKHSFTAMGTPATHTAAALEQISAILDFASLTPEVRARKERVARDLLRRHAGDVARVVDHMIRHQNRRARAEAASAGPAPAQGGSSSSSDEEAPAAPQAGPSAGPGAGWWGPHRGFRHHGPPHPHPYGGRWAHPPPPPPPAPGAAPPPPPGPPGSEGPTPWGPGPAGVGPFGFFPGFGPRGWY